MRQIEINIFDDKGNRLRRIVVLTDNPEVTAGLIAAEIEDADWLVHDGETTPLLP